MDEIKLYLDEDISQTLAHVLRSRGHDVVSAREIEMVSSTGLLLSRND